MLEQHAKSRPAVTEQQRVYIVTGGGAGIGEAAVKRLAVGGAAVVIADVDETAGARVASEVAAIGGRAAFTPVDVSKEADAEAMVRFAVDTYGRLDGAVNNAGTGQPISRLHEVSTETWDHVHSVDLRGVWLCMKAEITYFLTVGGGAIVNTASVAAFRPAPGQGAYTAAKHGVVGLTSQAAIEYVKDGIRVNAVAPGLVGTPQFRSYPEDAQKLYTAIQPGGRPAEPLEIANAMAWLLSDEASFVSGATLLVDAAAMQHL
jgi:NAD(P)-dependent dehydrogenase (short-subunit alcohol dehydrogenase family)